MYVYIYIYIYIYIHGDFTIVSSTIISEKKPSTCLKQYLGRGVIFKVFLCNEIQGFFLKE